MSNEVIRVKTFEDLGLAVNDDRFSEIILDKNIFYYNSSNKVLDFTVTTDKYIHSFDGLANVDFNSNIVSQERVMDFQRCFYVKNGANLKLEGLNITNVSAKRDCTLKNDLLDIDGYGACLYINNGNCDIINCNFSYAATFNYFIYIKHGNLFINNLSINNSVLKNTLDVYKQGFIYTKPSYPPDGLHDYGILYDHIMKKYYLTEEDFFNICNIDNPDPDAEDPDYFKTHVVINGKTYFRSAFVKFSIGEKFFYDVDKTITGFPDNFLYNFTELYSIDLRNKVMDQIGDNFLYGCTNLTEINNFNHLISDTDL